MDTVIFYFSGTGNSLFIARELARRLPGAETVPMVRAYRNGMRDVPAQAVGFVFPVHAFSLPGFVETFIKSLRLRPNAYLFAAATRGGSACRAFERMDRIFSRQGLCLQSRRFIDMPNNYLTLFKIPWEEEAARLTAQAREQADELAGHILARQVYRPRDPHDSFMESRVLFPLLERVFKATHFLHYGDRLCADAQCTGCSLSRC